MITTYGGVKFFKLANKRCFHMANSINTFIVYAREDKEIKNRVVSYLNPFRNPYNLIIWHDDNIDPGQLWQQKIKDNLDQTDLFLLLVSIDFLNSEFITKVECKYAIERYKQNKSRVIPIIIKPCPWDVDLGLGENIFNLAELQVLPDGARPITEWTSADAAYNNIATGIKKVLLEIIAKRKQEELETERQQKVEKENQFSREADDKKLEAGYQNKRNIATEKLNARQYEEALLLFEQLSANLPEEDDIRYKIDQCKEKIAEEDSDWAEASNSGNINAIRQFLTKHPGSKYDAKGNSLIATLSSRERDRKKQEVKPDETSQTTQPALFNQRFFAQLKKYRVIVGILLVSIVLIILIRRIIAKESFGTVQSIQARNERIVSETIDAESTENVDLFLKNFSPDVIENGDLSGPPAKGIDMIRKGAEQIFKAVPNWKAVFRQINAEGDSVTAYINRYGTFTGDVPGMKATGKHFSFEALDVYKLSPGGKIISHRSNIISGAESLKQAMTQ